ncbi:MAG: hypothetical protein FWD49_00995 [Firmicutes bacterium]|nr:hypothetical protein [Bacillota bacterium]
MKLKQIFNSELLSLSTLIAGLTYGMFYLDIENPFKVSLSQMGRSNHALFAVWCLLSGLALLVNIPYFYKRTQCKSRLGLGFLVAGLVCLIITGSVMGEAPAPYYTHMVTSILFAIFCFFALLFPIFKMLLKRDKRYIILSVIYFTLMLANIILISIFKQMAFYEFVALILTYFYLFFVNFTRVFDIKETETTALDT